MARDINGRLGMRWGQRLHYAMDEMTARLRVVLPNVAAVALGVAYLLPLGFYGLAFFHYQDSILQRTLPTQVVATCPQITDRELRFTNEKIEQIKRLPGVAEAFPKVELGAKASLESGPPVTVPIEGTIPGEPAFSDSRLAWGRAVTGTGEAEAILGLSLFRKLGGRLGDSGPTPGTLAVEIGRTAHGKEEVQRMLLRVVGLVKHQPVDKVHIPLTLAEHFDLWCTSKINSMPGTSGQPALPEVTYPACIGYVPEESVRRLERDAENLKIAVKPDGKVQVIEADGEIWASLLHNSGSVASAEQVPRAARVNEDYVLFRERVAQIEAEDGRKVCVVALADDDPRWQLVPGKQIPAFGNVLSTSSSAGDRVLGQGVAVPVGGRVKGFPLGGDYACSNETLLWLAFDVKTSPVVKDWTQVRTDDIRVAARWERDGHQVVPDCQNRWALYDIITLGGDGRPVPEEEPDVANAKCGHANEELMKVNRPSAGDAGQSDPVDAVLKRLLSDCPGVEVGVVHRGTIVLFPESLDPRDRAYHPGKQVRARFIPEKLFRIIAQPPAAADATAVPCVLVSRWPSADLYKGHVVGTQRLSITAIPGEGEELWFPDERKDAVCRQARKVGIAVYGSWQAMSMYEKPLVGEHVRLVKESGPTTFTMLFEGGLSSCQRYVGSDTDRCSFKALRIVPATVTAGGRRLASFCAAEPGLSVGGTAGVAVVVGAAAPGEWGQIEVGRGSHYRALLRADPNLHPDIALVDPSTFRRLAFQTAKQAGALPAVGVETMAARFADPVAFQRTRKALAEAGLALKPITCLTEKTLRRYIIHDRNKQDGTVGADLLAVLAMTKPTFEYVIPSLPLAATMQGTDITLEGTAAHDPRRFGEEVTLGRWLSDNVSRNEIVLPGRLLPRLGLRGAGSSHVGGVITAEFAREKRLASAEPAMKIPFRIVGITSGDLPLISQEVVRNVVLWRQGKLIFNERTMTFEFPTEIYKRQGHVRCNIYAKDPEAVAPLVAILEGKLGYRTQHSLAEQEGLRELGRVLIGLVVLFVAGYMVIAALSISVTTGMNIENKIREIGILRTQGAGGRDIMAIFGVQGFLIGVAAFTLASAAVVFSEPWLRARIGQAFNIPMGEIVTGSICSAATWWLFALAFLVAVLFSLAGVFRPARRACRLPLVDALRHRE